MKSYAPPWYANDLDLYKEIIQIPVLIAIDSKGMDYDFVNDFYNNALKDKSLCALISQLPYNLRR